MAPLLDRSAQAAALRIDLVLAQIQAVGDGVLHQVPPQDPARLKHELTSLLSGPTGLAGAVVYGPGGQPVLVTALPASEASDYRTLPCPTQEVGRLFSARPGANPVVPVRVASTRPGDPRCLVLLLRQRSLTSALTSAGDDDPVLQIIDLRALPDVLPTGPLSASSIAAAGRDAAVTPARAIDHAVVSARRTRNRLWAVVARMPEATVTRSSVAMARRLLPWALIGILLAAMTGIATALWVTFPLRRLTRSAEHLAHGSLTESTGIHRGDEVGQLAATFDAMAEELRRRWEENTELYRRELRRVHMLQALEEVAQAVNSTLSLDQVLETILRRSTQLVGVFVCAITLVDEQGQASIYTSSGLSDAFLKAVEKGEGADPCALRAIRERRILTVYDPERDPDEPELWRSEGVVALACAPMIREEQAIGCLSVYSKEQSYFTDEQLHVLAALAAQAAVAVQNAHLYEESQRKTREVRSSFRRIGAALASGLRLDDTLALIVELACEMLHSDACIIRLLDSSGTDLVARAAYGLGDDDLASEKLKAGEGLSGLVARTGMPFDVPDLLQDPRTLGISPESGIRAYLGVPLRVQSRVIGVLAVFRRGPYQFSPEEIELLSSFGAQASIALENRRLYEQESGIAHTLQRSLLPVVPRDLEGMELGQIYCPSQAQLEVGGDFFDLFPLDHGRFGVVMGDVCGKGLRAAVYTAMAKYAIRSYAYENPTPSEVMRKTNRALCRQITEEHLFVSIAYALLDAPAMTLALASAGHPPPLHYRQATRAATPLQSDGTLAGLLPNSRYTDLYVPLQPQDVLLFYTDGIAEARCGKEVWGGDNLARAVERHAHAAAPELVNALLAEGRAFAGGEIRDDVALLAIKIKG